MPVPSSFSEMDSGVVLTTRSPHAVLRPVPIRAVQMNTGFWQPRMERNRVASIPTLLALLESHGVVDNFRRVSGQKCCSRRGPLFTDSDLYKWMEAASWTLQSAKDPDLQSALDRVIDEVLAAQCADGYLNTWYVDERAGDRFTNLAENHELYCAGHLFQAAIAHWRTTGDRRLLDGAQRFADYLCDTFGPNGPVQGHAGHPEIEMALVELYRTTGERRYLDLAGYFLNHIGFPRSDTLAGHAVRQMYLCAGGVDYYIETGSETCWSTSEKLWTDLITGKMYITGGVGSRYLGEAFGEPFELPNHRSYTETCAAIGNGMWNWRMLLATGDARYADLFERVLYNGFLAGVSQSGTEYFYVNPLAERDGAERQPWYDVTCCPSNVERLIASLPSYMFSTSESGLYVHLYDSCDLRWQLSDGTPLAIIQRTSYPWDGDIHLEVRPEAPRVFDLHLRIPGWCRNPALTINGEHVDTPATPAFYCRLSREWKRGDTINLHLPMPVETMVADDRLTENRGCAALMRGPVLYCFEAADNPDIALDRVRLTIDPATGDAGFKPSRPLNLLGGVTVLTGPGHEDTTASATLYQPMRDRPQRSTRAVDLTAIPYHAWANRQKGAMTVWVPYDR